MSLTPFESALASEIDRFQRTHPTSRALSMTSQGHFLFGLPMHWMQDWPMPFSLHIREAVGSKLIDVDGHHYVDFCLGDTGAMFGHSPKEWVADVQAFMAHGITAMLPSADLPELGQELSALFGMSHWQLALSASDANRFLIRWARAATQRADILVFDGCYHGAVDDTLVDRSAAGDTVARPSVLGQVHNHHERTRVIPFNDLEALEQSLKDCQVACVLAEPALTNCGMVLPDIGFWEQAHALCQRYGTLLCIDETHTISTGLGGYCQTLGLKPDALVVGKAVAGGWPCALYGVQAPLAEKMMLAKRAAPEGHSGIGTTLTGGLLTIKALRSALRHLHQADCYHHMVGVCDTLSQGLRSLILQANMPWTVTQLGARLELQFFPQPARNAQEIRQGECVELEQFLHLFMINRGFVLTPFHNMMLCAPTTTQSDVARFLSVFQEWIEQVRQVWMDYPCAR